MLVSKMFLSDLVAFSSTGYWNFKIETWKTQSSLTSAGDGIKGGTPSDLSSAHGSDSARICCDKVREWASLRCLRWHRMGFGSEGIANGGKPFHPWVASLPVVQEKPGDGIAQPRASSLGGIDRAMVAFSPVPSSGAL